jgi:hypothetical protein
MDITKNIKDINVMIVVNNLVKEALASFTEQDLMRR